ncbi:hypothetical protein QTI17_17280 [Variovorax sp. J31P179]|uniref:hypothetical protein n=1 Tax=Variovorax sp. J31P179 TaxID=3053508 RepID=UPI0025764B2A|nr:hypothetical protein [Variovorax sp. J31P179]MDM0082348.1 hypothetical protein [Variovorax sp. J31P179]
MNDNASGFRFRSSERTAMLADAAERLIAEHKKREQARSTRRLNQIVPPEPQRRPSPADAEVASVAAELTRRLSRPGDLS